MKGEFEVGETKVVSGRVTTDKFSGNLVMSSPDVVAPLAELEKVGRAEHQSMCSRSFSEQASLPGGSHPRERTCARH